MCERQINTKFRKVFANVKCEIWNFAFACKYLIFRQNYTKFCKMLWNYIQLYTIIYNYTQLYTLLRNLANRCEISHFAFECEMKKSEISHFAFACGSHM